MYDLITSVVLYNSKYSDIEKYIAQYFGKSINQKLVFVDIPLLFEIKLEYLFDKVALVYANQKIQLERVMKRDNIPKEEALKIINSQMSIEEKKQKSDFIIENEATIEELQNKVEEFLDNRRRDENKKSRV